MSHFGNGFTYPDIKSTSLYNDKPNFIVSIYTHPKNIDITSVEGQKHDGFLIMKGNVKYTIFV